MSAKSFRRALILTPFFLIGLLLLAPDSIDPDPETGMDAASESGEQIPANRRDASEGTAESRLAPEHTEDRHPDAEQL